MTVCPEDRVTAFVAAEPMTIWEMVSDITRMAEWSPECYKAIWLTSSRGKGAVFLGLNKDGRLSWPSPAIVTESERPEVFAFRAASGVVWRYLLAPEGGGTRLVEERVTDDEFRWVRVGYRLFLGGYDRRVNVLRAGMRTTLERIKAAAEQSGE
jgi:polyketide cyclase/dehydrase/lipid transport protein